MSLINALIIGKDDNVVVVTNQIKKGEEVIYVLDNEERVIIAVEDIPIYHKVAIQDIKKGDYVKKYNEIIGQATTDIKKGMHVHCHNIESVG